MWNLRPDAISVWKNPIVRERLSWYYKVMNDEKPAKFMICKKIHVDYDKDADLKELWKVHDEKSKVFDELLQAVKEGKVDIEKIPNANPNFLDLKVDIAYKILESCEFCERRCGVNRVKGEVGVCGVKRPNVHSYFHHYGEEAPLVPSGTIFYGGCNLKCVFCQNHDISQEYPNDGDFVDAKKLASIQEELRLTGARNVNHVGGDPTPNLHVILESFKYLDVNVPQLWNSNMFCSVEAMKLLREVIDIWLPDLKYGNDRCAERLSLVKNYWSVVTRNMKWAHDWSDTIIRHLVLPNHLECCTKPILKWIAENCPRALVNIMEQYRPLFKVLKYPEKYRDIARRPTIEEMEEAYSYAKELGIVYEPVS
ncbi:radical SAM protein [Archaeoglobus sp.]